MDPDLFPRAANNSTHSVPYLMPTIFSDSQDTGNGGKMFWLATPGLAPSVERRETYSQTLRFKQTSKLRQTKNTPVGCFRRQVVAYSEARYSEHPGYG